MMTTVLLIGGDTALRQAVGGLIDPKKTCRLEAVDDVEAAIDRVRDEPVGVALIYLPSVRETAEVARFFYEGAVGGKPCPTVVLSEEADFDVALKFMRMGAIECMHRPLNLSRLSLLIDMLAARSHGKIRQAAKKSAEIAPSRPEAAPGEFLFHSPVMQAILDKIRLIAPRDTTVLLTGETGTGKTQLSRLLHQFSPRRSEPFLAVNCGALSSTLIESELFGHAKGAFTSADRDYLGKFAQARQGTLLLDELDSMPPGSQAKLLRAVEERMYEPVGSGRTQHFQARLLVATNKSLEEEVHAGRFRADLLYRLNVVCFHLPPLRERREDIAPLAQYYYAHFAKKHATRLEGIADEALQAMQSYNWPGNVRELRNVMERAVLLSSGPVINAEVLPEAICRKTAPTARVGTNGSRANGLARAKEEAEREELRRMLQQHGNNRALTAQKLGISRTALYKKLNKHRLL